MDDLISRQQAIDTLERTKDKKAKGDIARFYNQIIQNDIDALMQLPSAEQERKTGKWIRIHVSEEMWKCDQCGEISCCSPNFCPDCGAYMKGEQP